MNSSECLAMIQGDTTWTMDIDVIEDKRPTISIEWDFDTTARAYTAIGSFQDDFGVSSVGRSRRCCTDDQPQFLIPAPFGNRVVMR